MDNKILLIAGGGLALWYLMSKNAAPAAVVPDRTPAGPPPANPPSDPNTTPTPPQYSQTLARIQQAITSSGNSATFSYGLQSPDVWNTFAQQAIPNYQPPAPEDLFPGSTNAHAPVTFQVWWGALQKFLPQGLSGLGFRRQSPHWHMAGGWAV